jgi:hypothetical protein
VKVQPFQSKKIFWEQSNRSQQSWTAKTNLVALEEGQIIVEMLYSGGIVYLCTQAVRVPAWRGRKSKRQTEEAA